MNVVSLSIPADVLTTEDSMQLVSLLNEQIAALQPALDTDLRHIARLVRVESVRVTHVEFATGAHEVLVNYVVNWSLFEACRDYQDQGLVKRTVRGQLVRGGLEFALSQATERRSTADEL
jgi:hypothetical protein